MFCELTQQNRKQSEIVDCHHQKKDGNVEGDKNNRKYLINLNSSVSHLRIMNQHQVEQWDAHSILCQWDAHSILCQWDAHSILCQMLFTSFCVVRYIHTHT